MKIDLLLTLIVGTIVAFVAQKLVADIAVKRERKSITYLKLRMDLIHKVYILEQDGIKIPEDIKKEILL